MSTSPRDRPPPLEDASSPKSQSKKRKRTPLTKEQRDLLEKAFNEDNYAGNRKSELAKQTGLTPQQVMKWFDNRRIKKRKLFKTDSTSVGLKLESVDSAVVSRVPPRDDDGRSNMVDDEQERRMMIPVSHSPTSHSTVRIETHVVDANSVAVAHLATEERKLQHQHQMVTHLSEGISLQMVEDEELEKSKGDVQENNGYSGTISGVLTQHGQEWLLVKKRLL